MDLDFIRDALACPLNPVLDESGWRPAAVLLLICGRVPHVIMTEKPQHMRVHAGEISFPGGRPESVDADLCETALRETREEIGHSADRRSIVGQLGAVHTMNSRFAILPFVAVQEIIPPMRANAEVEAILRIPLKPLLETLAADTRRGKGMFTLQYMDKTIWGASARMLEQVSSRLAGRRADMH
ncbi:MAG: CoA pyrophosphatase [Nitrosopumilaceae archaeon]|nr:CoA pyrophosphatase [Nitrosopumilaceae archaeon]